jgi:hypothetical protein
VYGYTLAPTITWRHHGSDSGDLATAVAVGGVPHPSGYPTYLLLGDLFQLLPFADVAYRLNLLSATCAALTVVLVGLIIQQVASTVLPQQPAQSAAFSDTLPILWFCAVSAALLLAFSASFWSQAIIAEVYALNTFLAALLLYLALRVRPANQVWLAPAVFGLLGLSLGNHLSICFLGPALIGSLKVRWNRQIGLAIPLAFFAGLAVYGIIPLRAAGLPPVNWGGVANWASFGWLVGGAPYRHFLFALPPAYLPVRRIGGGGRLAVSGSLQPKAGLRLVGFVWLVCRLCHWLQHHRLSGLFAAGVADFYLMAGLGALSLEFAGTIVSAGKARLLGQISQLDTLIFTINVACFEFFPAKFTLRS